MNNSFTNSCMGACTKHSKLIPVGTFLFPFVSFFSVAISSLKLTSKIAGARLFFLFTGRQKWFVSSSKKRDNHLLSIFHTRMKTYLWSRAAPSIEGIYMTLMSSGQGFLLKWASSQYTFFAFSSSEFFLKKPVSCVILRNRESNLKRANRTHKVTRTNLRWVVNPWYSWSLNAVWFVNLWRNQFHFLVPSWNHDSITVPSHNSESRGICFLNDTKPVGWTCWTVPNVKWVTWTQCVPNWYG